jgi:hypothetical protein
VLAMLKMVGEDTNHGGFLSTTYLI